MMVARRRSECTGRTRLTGTRIYNELSNLQICDGFSRIDTEKTRKSPTAGGAAPTK